MKKINVSLTENELALLVHMFNQSNNGFKKWAENYAGDSFNPERMISIFEKQTIGRWCELRDFAKENGVDFETYFDMPRKVAGHTVSKIDQDTLQVGCTKVSRQDLLDLMSILNDGGK